MKATCELSLAFHSLFLQLLRERIGKEIELLNFAILGTKSRVFIRRMVAWPHWSLQVAIQGTL